MLQLSHTYHYDFEINNQRNELEIERERERIKMKERGLIVSILSVFLLGKICHLFLLLIYARLAFNNFHGNI